MGFFNDSAAGIVQLISLPLTCIGLMLTILEIYAVDISVKAEKYIDELGVRTWSAAADCAASYIRENAFTELVINVYEAVKPYLFPILVAAAAISFISDIYKTIMLPKNIPDMLDGTLQVESTEGIWGILDLMNPLELTAMIATSVVVIVFSTFIFVGLMKSFGLLFFQFSVGAFVRMLNALTNGKALGSIGLILGSLGLLGEVYQVSTMVNGWFIADERVQGLTRGLSQGVGPRFHDS